MGKIGNDDVADLSVVLAKISNLESKLDLLSRKMSFLEGNKSFGPEFGSEEIVAPPPPMESGGGFGDWVSKGALLQKMALICFILVFALLLRTVTDSGYINALAGSFIGLAYVSILALIGCFFYVTEKRMASVFAISGFLLLFAIVSEGTGRFATIPVGVAYAILLTALLTSAAFGIKYRVTKLLSVSLIGVTISSLVIGFPRMDFLLSGLLIFVVNWVAIIASERQVGPKLKWPVTGLTLVFWALWAFKAHVALGRGEPIPEYVRLNWLLPLLIGFVALYFMTYLRRYFSEVKLTVYDAFIPSLNMMMLFLAGIVVAKDHWQQPWIFGLVALAMGFIHFAVGWRLSLNDRERSIGIAGAIVAGSIALALGLPAVVGNVAWAISFWSLLAYALVRLSGLCNSGIIRVVSYIYQVFALFTGLALGVFVVGSAPLAPLTAAASLTLFALLQFRWCRHNPPPEGSLLAKQDSHDYSAVILLLVNLSGLYLLSVMILDLLAVMFLADPANTIKCGRSIIINAIATFLLVLGGRRRDLELIWIAVFLAIVGCLKVFLADLFGTSGVPLVLSVLSFGVVAMVGSIVMGRWAKLAEK